MSIASAIQAAQQKIANVYTAISNKGGTLPATQDLANMPTAINSITTTNFTSLNVTPSTTAQTLTPVSPYNGFNQVDVSAVTSSIDANITAGNIKKDVQILGVTGTYEGSGGGSQSILPPELFIGDIQSNGSYKAPPSSSTYNGNISFTGIKTISGASTMAYYLYATASTSRSGARRISGTVSFPDLETVTGSTAMQYMFGTQANITAAYFPKLQSITGTNAFRNIFQNCTGLRDVYFNGLLGSTAVASVQKMTNMLAGITGCTVHFPSNLQSVISSETIVTGGFGGISTVVLYDLPVSGYTLTVNVVGSQQSMFSGIVIDDKMYTSWSDFTNYSMTVELPVGQHPFTVDSGSAPASPSSGTIDLTSGDVTLTISVGASASTNNVTFNVTTLTTPSSLSIDGQFLSPNWQQSGSIYTVTLPETDGIHSYSISYLDTSWIAQTETGSFTINGSDVTVTIPSS